MGERLGGRAKGTPNKSTQRVKEFLDGVFEDAFARPEMRAKLVDDLARWKVDPKLLATLLAYYAGRPAVAVDHTVEGTLTLPELIVGTAAPAIAAAEADDIEQEPEGDA